MKKKKYVFKILFIIYILLVIRITTFPITIISREASNEVHAQFGKYIQYYQLIPFKTICGVGSYNFFKQIICNILMFIPFSILVKGIKSNLKGWQVILMGVICSLFIELLQLCINILTRFPNRVCDIDDLILNSIGVILGYGIYILVSKVSTKRVEGI